MTSTIAFLTSEREDALRETIFRFLFHPETARSIQTRYRLAKPDLAWKVYFIGDDEARNPSERLLNCFKNHNPPVKSYSDCIIDENATQPTRYQVKDRMTNEIGVIYSVGKLKWLSRDRVKVHAGYYSGSRSSMDLVLSVAHEKGKWHIKSIDTMRQS